MIPPEPQHNRSGGGAPHTPDYLLNTREKRFKYNQFTESAGGSPKRNSCCVSITSTFEYHQHCWYPLDTALLSTHDPGEPSILNLQAQNHS